MDPDEPVPEPSATMDVEIIQRPEAAGVAVDFLPSFMRSVARAAGAGAGEVTIVLTGDAEIRLLNRRYRQVDQATDVLAFPGEPAPDGTLNLGDIVISMDKARRQAAQRHHDLGTELRYLVIHGFLHLLGHDHETDDGEMEALERSIRSRCLAPSIKSAVGGKEAG